ADVELAVLALGEAVGAGDDHGADRAGAHDVAVVVDLDATRRGGQAETLGKTREQLALGGRFGEFAAERLARIGQRMLDKVALLAALRAGDRDPVAAPLRQSLLEELALLDLVRKQDEPRDRLVVVELGEEGAQDGGGVEAPV